MSAITAPRSCGRGRGRARGRNTPLPKPGHGPCVLNTKSDNKSVPATTTTAAVDSNDDGPFCDYEKAHEDLMDQVLSVNFGKITFDSQLQSVHAHFMGCGSKEKVE